MQLRVYVGKHLTNLNLFSIFVNSTINRIPFKFQDYVFNPNTHFCEKRVTSNVLSSFISRLKDNSRGFEISSKNRYLHTICMYIYSLSSEIQEGLGNKNYSSLDLSIKLPIHLSTYLFISLSLLCIFSMLRRRGTLSRGGRGSFLSIYLFICLSLCIQVCLYIHIYITRC